MNDLIRFSLADGLELAGGDLDKLWWRYVAIGGDADPQLLADRISGLAPCVPREYSTIAQALNECFVDRGMDTFPVGYRPQLASSVGRVPTSRSPHAEARRRAVEARMRSAAAAHHAALLHLTASRLMMTSGQLKYARQAQERADRALARARRAVWVASVQDSRTTWLIQFGLFHQQQRAVQVRRWRTSAA